MRLDDTLWQVPASPSPPEEDLSGEPRASQTVGEGAAPVAPPSAPPLPSNQPSLLTESQPDVEGGLSKAKASSIASKVVALAAEAAKALVEPPKSIQKKSNDTNSSNDKDAKVSPTAKASSPKKDNLPGETGYLRPFYRKGDNNPFVDEEDTMSYYGRGMNSQGSASWRNGRPYLPVLHQDSASAVTAKPASINEMFPVVEGGEVFVEATSTVSSVPPHDDIAKGDTAKGTAKPLEDKSKLMAEGFHEQPEKLPTPLAQTADTSEEDSYEDDQEEGLKTISKAKKPEYIEPVDTDKHKTQHDEMPQSDEPFVDWPDWDSSLFDDFTDDDAGKDKDVGAKKVKEDAVSKVSAKENSDDFNEEMKVSAKSDFESVKQKDGIVDENDASDEEIDSDDNDDEDDDYDEDYDYYDEDDDNESDENDNDENDEDDDSLDSDDEDDKESYKEDDKPGAQSSSSSDSGDKNSEYYYDSYYYDDEDDEDSGSKEDSYEVVEQHDGGITISPIKASTPAPSRVASRKKRLDWDEVPVEAEQPLDESHYNKGVIYDAPPVHKGKGDAASNSHSPQDTDIHIEEDEVSKNERSKTVASPSDNPTMIRSKKGTSLTQFHTASDASTSPNPRPPGVAGGESGSTTTPSPTTTSSTTTTTTSTTTTTTTTAALKSEAMDDKLPVEDLEHLPVSYPLGISGSISVECVFI